MLSLWWEFLNLISVTLIYIDDVPVLKWPVSQYGQTWPPFEDQILFVWEKTCLTIIIQIWFFFFHNSWTAWSVGLFIFGWFVLCWYGKWCEQLSWLGVDHGWQAYSLGGSSSSTSPNVSMDLSKEWCFFSAARVSHSHKMIQNDHWLGNRKYWESNDIEKEMMEIWIWGSIFWTSPWLATPKQSQTPSHMKFLVLTVDRESNGKSPLFFTAEISNWVVHCILLHLPRKDAKEISCTCAYIYILVCIHMWFRKKKDIIFKYMISKKNI